MVLSPFGRPRPAQKPRQEFTNMKPTICFALLWMLSGAVFAQEAAVHTVLIKFENELVPTGGAGIGGCMDVVRQGEYLYTLQGPNLTILSLANPAAPKMVGELENVGNLRQIVVRGKTAFITAREDGLFVVDVSDLARPKVIARYDTVEFATGIDVKDGYAFIACRWFGVEIVDVSDVKNPKHVSVVRVGEAQSCEVSDGYLYAGAWEERRVAICDVRNPAAPKQVATVRLDGRGDGICVRNGILYAAMGHHRPGANLDIAHPGYGAGNGMDIYDVSDPARPKHLSRVKFDWRFYYGWPDTWRVTLSYPYAYLYHTYNGVFVFDVSDPRNPRELAQIRIPLYPGDKGFRKLNMTSKNGLRLPVLPFDPTKKMYSPVCGLVATDGYLYFTGLYSDLHVFRDAKLAKAETETKRHAEKRLKLEGDFHRPDLAKMQKELSPPATDLKYYRPGGQVYAAVENDGLVYAACGSAGIHVLDKNLRPQAKYATRGFAMDLQAAGNKLYAAESSGGLGCYHVDGAKLGLVSTYVSKWPIKQVRVSADGRFAVVHAGGGTYEILDVSDWKDLRLVKTERGWGGLVYYRQLCNGFIDGKTICGTWCGGRTFMTDLSGAKPKPLPDVMGILPDMEAGGYCPCGPYALATREGGYSFFKPGYEGKYEDLPVYTIQGGPKFYGKPTCRGNLLVTCNRISGEVTLVDICDLSKPKRICQFKVSGNADCAFVGETCVLIPAGYQGLFRCGWR
jgi:hypothetical protein